MDTSLYDDVWHSVRLVCEPGFEDILRTAIFESGFSGLEERAEAGKTVFIAFFHPTSEATDPLESLNKTLNECAHMLEKKPARLLSVEEIPTEDWESKWREGLGAVEIGSRLIVRPSWIEYPNPDGQLEIIIDPKMGFGTGGHPTTRLCLETLEEMNPEGLSVLDAGCGSGVLSIAAAKLGARCAIGFDKDSDSVRNAVANIKINRVQNCVTVYKADLSTVKPGCFNIVFANMMSSVLMPNLGRFFGFLLPEGRIIFSGLLAEEETHFIKCLEKEGYRVCRVRRIDEWIAVEVIE